VASDADPWADREGPYSLPRYVTEQATTDFFVPYVGDAEDAWSRFAAGRPAGRRVYSLTHAHHDQKIEVTVGEERKVYSRNTRGRGGAVPGVDFDRRFKREGSAVLAIVDSGALIEIWSVAVTGRWANPSVVDPATLERIQYFKGQS
jgi:hypothetical protein